MVRVGVIGAGYWGSKLARIFDSLPACELTWICDIRQDRIDQVKGLYPEVNTAQDFRLLLASDVDAVVVATPVVTHHPLAIEALRAGKHVLVEKPLTADIAEAEEIVAEGEMRKRVVMVGHTSEYSPAVESMKSIIDSGELGEILCIYGIRVNLGRFRSDVDVVWDLGAHDVSILLFVLGMEPEAVSARGRAYVRRDRKIYDVVTATLYFPDCIMVDLRISWLDPQKVRKFTVIGSRKMLVLDDSADDRITIFDKRVDIDAGATTDAECELSYHDGGTRPGLVEWSEPLQVECRHFLKCIDESTAPRSGARVGLKVVKVLEAMERSLVDEGTVVSLTW